MSRTSIFCYRHPMEFISKIKEKMLEMSLQLNAKRSVSAIAVFVLFFLVATVKSAYAAFDATAQANSILSFIALVILIAAAIGALTKLIRGEVVQAILLVLGAGLLFFLIGTPDQSLKAIGQGISNLLFGSGGSSDNTSVQK